VKEATLTLPALLFLDHVSIHAPVKEATELLLTIRNVSAFRSTPP
jgi:hypothetical protein